MHCCNMFVTLKMYSYCCKNTLSNHRKFAAYINFSRSFHIRTCTYADAHYDESKLQLNYYTLYTHFVIVFD